MIHIFTALLPIFSLIMIGYFFKKIKFPSHDFWPNADKLTYFVLMPSLLIYKLSHASLEGIDSFNFILTALLGIFVVLLVLMLINKFYAFRGDAFTSIVQGGIRFNTYVFLALIDSIYGDQGLILGAILITFVIPFINVLCITSFALYVTNDKLDFKYLIKSIITNPLIIACFIGGSINFIGFNMPVMIDKILAILSSAALPLGLLSVGFGLVLTQIKEAKTEIFHANFSKLVITPVIFYAIAYLFDLDAMMVSILIIFAVLPTAPSSFVLARQLGGDVKLMSSIITVQTLLSAPFIILALHYFV